MMSLIVEAVVISFCVGGVIGAVITMHLQPAAKRAETRVKSQHQVQTQRNIK